MLIENLAFIFLGYLCGSIPTALIIGKIFLKKDIRKIGSGNIGATNMVRAGGKKLGALTFLLDVFKASFVLIYAKKYGINNPNIINIIGLMVVIGHCFPIWLKFKGGKGVASFIGVIFILDPILTIFILIGWYIIFYITQIVSLSSIITMITLILYFIFSWNYQLIYLILAAIIIIFRHKENIKLLLQGKEKSFKK